jgi:signal transduction histidine kinase
MASPTGIKTKDPASLTVGLGLVVLLVFSFAIGLVIYFSILENQRVLEYEASIILKGNGKLLQIGDVRGFSEAIPREQNGFKLKVKNITSNSDFTFSSSLNYEYLLCTEEKYLQYDISFCRPFLTPWRYMSVLVVLFIFITAYLVSIFKKLNHQVIEEFRLLFEAARIPYEGQLTFIRSWEIAKKMASLFKKSQQDSLENERNKATSLMAKQVAHDIRSPLSALNMMLPTLGSVPEDKQKVIESAIERINSIAADLLEKGTQPIVKAISDSPRSQAPGPKMQKIILSELVDKIIFEKQNQFRDKSNLKIRSDIDAGSGDLINANSNDLMRVLSNLINNSVEALPGSDGEVTVTVRTFSKAVHLTVKDSGVGIPKLVLERLGEPGVTYGKEGSSSGAGLGIFHAKRTIASFGGTFNIISQDGVGTLIVCCPGSIVTVGRII